ncbi:PREDICTED: vacuolar protein sorting-associated protein 36-like isoform X1 [Fragaria vesca subsp. vesca]|uniref:vacuolar protein sorting-associated protein 36-like isoform X1 n=1 Tax=Fragaria vesca subsp. vesca TaxID=101020 RepID=UPI0002C3037D|nr:PREDICTED: vacuolar protein sorting-associated protein 36-like isoform X1 [Fragaria vesca subsp. vesca]
MAGNCLEVVELTSSGRPVLLPSEIECSLLSAVDLECEELPNFPNLKSAILTLTTHRLLWLPDSSSQGASSAIPLASITHIFSAKKSLKSMFASPRIRFQLSVSPDGRVSSSGSGSRSIVVTVVVRGKGADLDVFLTKFWDNWRGRAWETGNADVTSGSVSGSGSTSSGLYTKEGTVRMVGVSGILRKEQEMWETTDKSLQDAFQDLNALMSKAKEMVLLAEKMRQKLLSSSTSQPSAAEDEELGSKQEMQDWLLSVGIISPVTKESAGALYHQQLSRQLADFVRLPLERAGGMMNLIDIYCLFNRARGTELISPEDLLQACVLWEKFDVPVMLRKFDSGVMVIQNKSHSDEEIFAKIKTLATQPDALRTGISARDAAITVGIAPGMAKEHLLTAESKGYLCRDISADGFRFYINLFPEIDPNNVYLVKDYGVYDTWLSVASASG